MLKKFLFIFSVVAVILSSCNKDTEKQLRLNIIVTTDIHGSLYSYDFIEEEDISGSLSSLTGFIAEIEEQNGNDIILLDNGDILQGDPSVYYHNYIDTSGEHLVSRMLNYIGYDAATVGNHDVEPGHEVYDKIQKEYEFPWLAANVIDKRTDRPYFTPYTVIEKNQVKVAVLGLVTPTIPRWLPEQVYSGMKFKDMLTTAEKWVKTIKEKEDADVIVGLFHSGLGELDSKKNSENAVLSVAHEVDGLDIIFYGHDHHEYNNKITNNSGEEVLLLNPGANANKAAMATINVMKKNSGVQISGITGSFIELKNYSPTQDFEEKFNLSRQEIQQYVNKELTWLPESLSTRNAFFGPSRWMQLIHETQLTYTGADISFSAPLSMDEHIIKGSLTVGELFKLYRFRNLLYTIELTGKEIKDYLEYSYSSWFNTIQNTDDHLLKFKLDSTGDPEYSENYGHHLLAGTSYNFDSGYGIDYTVDLTQQPGKRIDIHSFSNGKPFHLNQKYSVALNSYRANGGGGHLTDGVGLTPQEIDERIKNVQPHDVRYLIRKEVKKNDTLNISLNRNWKVEPFQVWNKTKSIDSLLIFN